MKKNILVLFITVCIVFGVSDAVAQDLIDVTFRANTATWRDTLGADGLVQIRGTIASVDGANELSDGVIIDWNANTTMYLTNVEGDYWEGTFKIPEGTLLVYKFFVNARHSVVEPGDEWEHDGWENNISDGFDDDGVSAGTNRLLDLTDVAEDLVLPLQFVNGIGHGDLGQYEKPYEEIDGTFAVYLRVNMAGWEDFNPDNHVVGVRGSNMSDWGPTGQISWGETYALNREGLTRFYSNVVNVPDQYADAGVQFKFVVHFADRPLDEDWGNMAYNPDAEYQVSTAGNDTTVYWKWFDNLKPIAMPHEDEIIITFQADMSRALQERGFSHGDTLEVRYGYGGSALELGTKQMIRFGFTNIYTVTDTIMGTIGGTLLYQYYMWKDGLDLREIYFDFTVEDPGDPNAERRRVVVTSSPFVVEDLMDDISEQRRKPRFRNTSRLTRDVTVTFTVDIRPAIYQILAGSTLEDIQGPIHIDHPDSVMALGVFINGPASGGWAGWGIPLRNDETRTMTHIGDSIYAIEYSYTTDDIVGQEFKFGIGGGDNEGGFGNNHIENIDDSEATFTIHSQFGSIDPLFYWAWDYENQMPVSVEDSPHTPLTFKLSQNYPNPFNPATTIVYQLPQTEKVILKVYNILGQEVATLVNEVQTPGNYRAVFDASRLASGVYIYRLQAGSFTDVKRMVLIK